MIIEHVMQAVLPVSDRVIVISYGEKIAEDFPQEVCNNQAVISAYLGRGYAYGK
jgi:branched-chain amino acid transport system ATP-binding protein